MPAARIIYVRETATPTAPQVQASATPVADPTDSLNAHSSQFVPILAIGIVIIVAVAGLFAYRAWKGRQMVSESRRQRHERALSAWYNGSDAASISSIEKPARAALAHGDVEAYAGWAPQVRTWRGIHVQGIELPAERAARLKAAEKDKKEKEKEAEAESEKKASQPSPPPAYVFAQPTAQIGSDAKPSPPFATSRKSPPPAETESTIKMAPSPKRSSSLFATQQQASIENNNLSANPFQPSTESDDIADQKILPRVMIVTNTYQPSLPDELSIIRGEAIRMLAEYQDGWCVVQRVGPFDSPKGVVPRSCLAERMEIMPGRRI